MAKRPIFIPKTSNQVGVDENIIDFKWHAGFAKVQKQKSIDELHATAKKAGIKKILEISSKSKEQLGIDLSAFNLIITTKKNKNKFTVETAFQGSKVFERGGPYKDLFGMESLLAKRDTRLKESGNLIGFEFFGEHFQIKPRTFFYDWLYIQALNQHDILKNEILSYNGFSDIEFNPKKSINCQAHSVALYVSLSKNSLLDKALISPSSFLEIAKLHYSTQTRNIGVQSSFI